MECVLGCDIGSQGVKVLLVSSAGDLLGESGAGYDIDYPRPTWAEQSAEAWLAALTEALAALKAVTGFQPDQIRAIGLDAQVDGVVPIDAAGRPLRPAIIWMDRRAVAQCDAAGRSVDPARLFQLSGLNLDASHVAPKIRWLADHQTDIFDRTYRFLLPCSYVAYALTGELAVDYSNASSTLLMDMRSRSWSGELCAAFGVDPARLPPIAPATAVLGHLRPAMAERLGLRLGTPVMVGSGDEHAACLGAGVVRPGLVADIAGTAEPVCAASPGPVLDPTGLVETHCHADPDTWLLENPGFVSGANYRWFRDHFAPLEVAAASQGRVSAYDLLDDLAAAAPPGSAGLVMLPCLMGAMAPAWNASARGTFVGFTLAHGREHFVRAILEASAYAVRDIVDQMRRMGLPLASMRVVGGGARSRLWRQIKADVTGLPVALTQTVETTALGAAMLALVGAGAYESLAQSADHVVRIVETLDPDPGTQKRYEDYYQLYRAAYFALVPVFDQAARISAHD
jgi:xylulokinase